MKSYSYRRPFEKANNDPKRWTDQVQDRIVIIPTAGREGADFPFLDLFEVDHEEELEE